MANLKFIAPKNFWAKVEKTNTCWNWQGKLRPDGYGQVNSYGEVLLPHRISYALANNGVMPKAHVDHICHNRSCVNPDHLRLVTRKQNMENRSGASKVSSTGIRGVEWCKAKNKYRAKVGHCGKVLHVGYFSNLRDAEAAAIAKRNELFTHNNLDRI